MKEYLLELFFTIVILLIAYGLVCEFIDYITKEPLEESTITVYIDSSGL